MMVSNPSRRQLTSSHMSSSARCFFSIHQRVCTQPSFPVTKTAASFPAKLTQLFAGRTVHKLITFKRWVGPANM